MAKTRKKESDKDHKDKKRSLENLNPSLKTEDGDKVNGGVEVRITTDVGRG